MAEQRLPDHDVPVSPRATGAPDVEDGHLHLDVPGVQPQPRQEEEPSTPQLGFPFDENLFYSGPVVAAQATEQIDNEAATTTTEPLHPADFKPFFTLIEDPQTGNHHRPTVHYLFSDDDPEILTAAVLDSLDTSDGRASWEGPSSSHAQKERCVIVDVAADGKRIVSASSLSSEWQAVRTSLAPAPSWGEDPSSGERGLMLKISGQEDGWKAAGRDGSVEELVQAFNKRLEKLDQVLDRT